MNKYRNLLSNTIIFSIGTFGSKVLSFALMFFLTDYIKPADMSGYDIAVNVCNFILPIMYLCVSEAVVRYGLDSSYKRADIFTTGFLTVIGGYLVFLVIFPLAARLGGMGAYIEGYENLIRFFVLASAARTVTSHFVRAGGLVRIFALDGMITSVTTVLLVALFVIRFDMGGYGYMLATICADGFSALSMILALRLFRFFNLRRINLKTARVMLRYSVPLVPAALFWWVTNLSNRFFITAICGPEDNGVFAISARIPTMIVLVSYIFTSAWQLSAFTEYRGKEGQRFYSNIFRSYYSLVFLAASGLMLIIKPFIGILNPDYGDAWRYSLFLLLATAFSCLVTFLGTIYNAMEKNAMVTITTAIGGAVNIGLNLVLIPRIGPLGAALATFISYLVVFTVRAVDTRKYIRIDMQPMRIAASLAILVAQALVTLSETRLWVMWQIVLFLALLLCNLGYVWFMAKRAAALLGFMGKGSGHRGLR